VTPLPVHGLGDAALECLQTTGSTVAPVVAVFDRCFYLRLADSMLCVAAPGLGLGPLTLQLSDADFKIASKQARDHACITLGYAPSACSLHWQDAAVWSSTLPVMARDSSADMTRRWLDTLVALAPKSTFISSLSDTGVETNRHDANPGDANPGDDSAVAVATRHYLSQCFRQCQNELKQIIANDHAVPLVGFEGLVGAGPGLTPTGDDVLAGALLTLHVFDHRPERNLIWQQLQPLLARRTHKISSALLAMAALGKADATLHSIFQAWADNKTIECQRSATLLGTLGQSSGWDTLAGIFMVSTVIGEMKDAAETSSTRKLVSRELVNA